MKLAFSLFKYFPYGGLQRDCIKIAQECVRRGHQVDVYCREWSGPQPQGIDVKVLPVKSWSNYRCYELFAERVRNELSEQEHDALIGFNRMADLDFYFGADPCFALKLKHKPFWYKYLPRSRSFLQAEDAVYGSRSSTRILLLSEIEVPQIQDLYGTPSSRFYLLPPGVEKNRVIPADYDIRRRDFRRELGLKPEQKLLLMVGSGFRVKGVDRALEAMAMLPEDLRSRCVLMILGRDNKKPFEHQARRLGLGQQVQFMGGRDDAADFMFAADLLVHPAYREAAGMVLVEAIAARLPVLVTDTCGYSFHITSSKAGLVHSSPFNTARYSVEMMEILTSDRDVWRRAADEYLAGTDIFGMAEAAVDVVEEVLAC